MILQASARTETSTVQRGHVGESATTSKTTCRPTARSPANSAHRVSSFCVFLYSLSSHLKSMWGVETTQLQILHIPALHGMVKALHKGTYLHSAIYPFTTKDIVCELGIGKTEKNKNAKALKIHSVIYWSISVNGHLISLLDMSRMYK